MSIKENLNREAYVVVHGQSARFRIVKYIIILAGATGIYFWKGPKILSLVLLGLVAIGTIVHFVFRFKTQGWTKPWGPYKKVLLK